MTKDEKCTLLKEKRWRKFSTIVSLVIYISFIVIGIDMLSLIPYPSGWFLELLVIIDKVIVVLILLIINIGVAAILTIPLWKKVESLHIPSMKKEIFSKACEHLRDFYELQEPYIITKCFDSTDKKFQNHDVCIFVVGDELRLTTDIVHGFLYLERDLGCYAFKQDEITLSKQQNGDYLVAELKADNTVFLLAYRAKSFIEKTLLEEQTD